MAVKKSTPSNIKLTLKTAHELAKRELGTAKGLTQEESALKDWYYMTVGNLTVRIHPDRSSGCIMMTASWAAGMHETNYDHRFKRWYKNGPERAEYWPA